MSTSSSSSSAARSVLARVLGAGPIPLLAVIGLLLIGGLYAIGGGQDATKPKRQGMKIQEVTSPGGIKAWLVEEHAVPLMAMRFAFWGGNAQDPAGKEGLANFMASTLDEGAGDLNSSKFHERMEELSVRLSFEDDRDALYGSFETLTENRDAGIELLQFAVNKPRFDAEAVERIRNQLRAGIVYADRDPNRVAGKQWSRAAFPSHPYGRPSSGTQETVGTITRDDLAGFHKRVFAKENLSVVVVGDIDAKTLGVMLDKVFGSLPAKPELSSVAATVISKGGKPNIVEMDVPQSVAVFGLGAVDRKDKDFMPLFVLNHILGGGGFASRLMEEVREKRGLAYSVYTQMSLYKNAAVISGAVATKNEQMGQSLQVIKDVLKSIEEKGPSQAELDAAKSYLTGSFALRFDTNAKIANQLLWVLMEGLGKDYIDKRNQLVDAVTLADVKRAAQRIVKVDDLVVTIVGKPQGV